MRHLVVFLCVVAVGCGPGEPSGPPESDRPLASAPFPTRSARGSSSPSPDRTDGGTEILTADSEHGPMLYDVTGQPIYLFTAEAGGRPACYDACMEDWPPVLTTGAPRAVGDVRPSLLGTTRRADGRTQVTYADHPLYYYAHEGKYQVLCHDVEEYGGIWLVVRPNGMAAPS
jgi:predicted lipoprotein with Yx(FWY)xxD motif